MRNNKINFYITIFFGIQIVFVQFISNFPSFVERYYSNGIYPYISSFFRILFGWIPFSVGDVLLAFLVFIFLRFLYRLIKSKFKNIISKILQLTATLSVIYFCFYLFWGLNYFREPLSKNLDFKSSKYTTEELAEVTKKIILTLNKIHHKITENNTLRVIIPYTKKEIYSKAIVGYNNIAKKYPQLEYHYPSVKSSLMSLIQTYNGTSGYLNPLTGEAHINNLIPKTSYPITTCHEMAHQIGFAAENEANFIGFLASVSNDDIYFKYSGYRMAFAYTISEVRKRDKELASQLFKLVDKGIVKDFRFSSSFWKKYQNPIEPIIKKGYNSYLKANKQSKGIDSYNYVVDLLINYELSITNYDF